jgi:HAD superfamily hydrolase (TIGR01509 family)
MIDSTPELNAVVFDLDGLLVNSEDLYEQAGETVLGRRGKTYDARLREQMMGRPVVDAIKLMKDCHALPDPLEELMCECRDVLEGLMAEMLAPMPGVRELIEDLQAAQIPTAVATSGTREYAHGVLARLHLKHCFRFILTADDVARGKPDPEVYLLAARRLGLAPLEMMVLEDSGNVRRSGAQSAHEGSFVHRCAHDCGLARRLAYSRRAGPLARHWLCRCFIRLHSTLAKPVALSAGNASLAAQLAATISNSLNARAAAGRLLVRPASFARR